MGMQERALSIGGEIQIDSEPGKGTSITLLLNKKD
jgi:signal transduction histidine kinase